VTIASTFGSFVGYNIGYWLYTNGGDKLIYYFVSQENFQKLVEYYKKYELLTIGLISLTPIPFKALTISAGFCQLPLLQFIIYSTISRGIKFYTIAISIYFLGDKIKYYLDRYFYYILTIFILSFIIIFKILH
jgi:membrane protein YqaA with SNARE-associated domain